MLTANSNFFSLRISNWISQMLLSNIIVNYIAVLLGTVVFFKSNMTETNTNCDYVINYEQK